MSAIREIKAQAITDAVRRLAMEANVYLPEDVKGRLADAQKKEQWILASDTLGRILSNAELAAQEQLPMCQDTGMAVVFVELGQEVHVSGASLEEAINEGVRRGYADGYLRKSVVQDPLRRVNTKDNTPAVINVRLVPGDRLRLMVAPKGFGSENMSQLKMLKPSDGRAGVKEFILKVCKEAGPNACPPIVVGVGLGGTFDKAASLAKHALMRPLDQPNADPYYADFEAELLAEINRLGIGPQGYGGATTAIAVAIETYPTHIAGLPVAVNINCHATRHRDVIL
ncbi:Fumarate hydratase class I, aerobic [Clostridiaceae bacterium JG1575]|nr:Fumarate hydratase class I, aerobic [Clostridiaceae bacterium JG1575]